MSKNRHHYVPRLYLRNFSSGKDGEDIINMYNLRHGFARRDVGLRSQCYRWKFYGETDDLEDALCDYENGIAPLLKRVIASNRLPEAKPDLRKLYEFIALLILRNPEQVERVNELWQKMKPHLEPRFSKYGQPIPPEAQPSHDVRASLALWPLIVDLILDLGIKLVLNRTDIGLIASDNPGVKYNKLCEEIKGIGVYGYSKIGLQVFLPISPLHLLVLFDRTAYTTAGQGAPTFSTKDCRDIHSLNLLQAINAEEKLLFARWDGLSHVQLAHSNAERHRKSDRTQVVEAFADDDPEHHSVLHSYDTTINVKLNLSFMGIKKEAKRLSWHDLALLLRESCPEGARINRLRRENRGGVVRRFTVKRPDRK